MLPETFPFSLFRIVVFKVFVSHIVTCLGSTFFMSSLTGRIRSVCLSTSLDDFGSTRDTSSAWYRKLEQIYCARPVEARPAALSVVLSWCNTYICNRHCFRMLAVADQQDWSCGDSQRMALSAAAR